VIKKLKATFELITNKARLDRAERALISAGWTYIEGAAEWKPPIGPSASPLLERITELERQLVESRDFAISEAARIRAAYEHQNTLLAWALETITHSMEQASVPGNDIRREIKLSKNTAAAASELLRTISRAYGPDSSDGCEKEGFPGGCQ
jgi:hypothetical protein